MDYDKRAPSRGIDQSRRNVEGIGRGELARREDFVERPAIFDADRAGPEIERRAVDRKGMKRLQAGNPDHLAPQHPFGPRIEARSIGGRSKRRMAESDEHLVDRAHASRGMFVERQHEVFRDVDFVIDVRVALTDRKEYDPGADENNRKSGEGDDTGGRSPSA